MARRIGCFAVVVALTALTRAPFAHAEDLPSSSCGMVSRDILVRCALAVSASVRVEREGAAAAVGRRTAAAPWFPANPVLAVSLARRDGTEGRPAALNYSASLSQEIELAGQRSARRRAAEAEVSARAQDIIAMSRRAAASAYSAFFDVLAAREAALVARRLETTALQVARVASARADAGVASQLDAQVAESASLRIVQSRMSAELELRAASARLATLLGRDPARDSVAVSGVLEPLAGSDVLAASTSSRVVLERPELRALASEQRAFEARADAFRRARVPTLTLQVFAQNDGYDERVLGGGIIVPIPLPEPVGRFYGGEIAEAEALARKTNAQSESALRALGADLAVAVAGYQTRRTEADLYTKERVTRAEQLMSEIGKEIEAGRLPVRDAILAQAQLMDVLRGHVETRHALCLASVDLAIAAGVALEAGPR